MHTKSSSLQTEISHTYKNKIMISASNTKH